MTWGSPVETERRRRILVAAWAYAYEYLSESIVDDATFDRESALIDPSIDTGNPRLDRFFRTKFNPCTGMWVHRHPDRHGLERMCKRLLKER